VAEEGESLVISHLGITGRTRLLHIPLGSSQPASQHVCTVSLPHRLSEVCRGIARGNLGLH